MYTPYRRNADGTLAVSRSTKVRVINWINDLEDLMNLSIPARIKRQAELSKARIEARRANASL